MLVENLGLKERVTMLETEMVGARMKARWGHARAYIRATGSVEDGSCGPALRRHGRAQRGKGAHERAGGARARSAGGNGQAVRDRARGTSPPQIRGPGPTARHWVADPCRVSYAGRAGPMVEWRSAAQAGGDRGVAERQAARDAVSPLRAYVPRRGFGRSGPSSPGRLVGAPQCNCWGRTRSR